MKKILLAAILLLGVVYYAAISSFTAIGVFGADGYIFSDNEVQENISSENFEEVEAHEIKASDVIYSRMSSLYVGDEQKSLINTDYPMYTNGGAAVQFLSSDATLINSDFDLSASYDGLVINDLDAFNTDGSRSDWEEYIFSKLNNGLFVNLGSMEIENGWGRKYTLPANSMMSLSYNDGIKFYSYSDGTMEGNAITSVDPDSIIRIGSVEISYEELLKELKLMSEEKEETAGGWVDEEDQLADGSGDDEGETSSIGKNISGSSSAQGGSYTGRAGSAGSGKDSDDDEADSDSGSDRDSSGGSEGGDSSEASSSDGSGKGKGKNAAGKEKGKTAASSSSVATSGTNTNSNTSTSGGSSSTSGTSSGKTGSGSVQEYTEPKVTPGTDYTVGAHYLKTSVSIEDLSGLLTTSGIVYEVTGPDGKARTTSIRPNGDSTQTVFIAGLTPGTDYNLRAYYSFKKKVGDNTIMTTVMVIDSYDFTTKSTWESGSIKLNDMSIKTADIRSNQIQIPSLSINKDSNMEAMAVVDSVIVSFTSLSDMPVTKSITFTAAQLSKLLSYQSVTVYSGKNLESNKEYAIYVKFLDADGNEIKAEGNTEKSRTCKNVPTAVLKVDENDSEHVVISWEIGSEANTAGLESPVLKIKGTDSTFITLDTSTKATSIDITKISTTSSSDGITRGSVSLPAELFTEGLKYTARIYANVDIGDSKGKKEQVCGGVSFVKKGAYTVTPNNVYDIGQSTLTTGITITDPDGCIDSVVYAIYDMADGTPVLLKNYDFDFDRNSISKQDVIIPGLAPDHKYKLTAKYGYSTKDSDGNSIDGTQGIKTFIDSFEFTTKAKSSANKIILEDLELSTGKVFADHIRIPNIKITLDSDGSLVDSIASVRIIFTNRDDQSTSVVFMSSDDDNDYKDDFDKLVGYYDVAVESAYELKENSVYDISMIFYDSANNELPLEGGTGTMRTCYKLPEVNLSLDLNSDNKLQASWTFYEPENYTLSNYRMTVKDQTGTQYEFDGKSYLAVDSLQSKDGKGKITGSAVFDFYVDGNTYTVNLQAYGDIGDGSGFVIQKLGQTLYPLGEYAAEEAQAAVKDGRKAQTSKKTSEETLIETPNYQEPVVTAGTDFTPGVYTFTTSVTIDDPSNAIIGGITYEITILDEYGKGSLYKKYSVSGDGSGKSQVVLVPGLKPDSHYQITGTYRYRDKYGRPVSKKVEGTTLNMTDTGTVIFLDSYEFETKEVQALGSIYLSDMLLDDAILYSNTVSIPRLMFDTASDNDAVGSLSRVTIKFSDGTNDYETTLTSSQLEKLSSYQAISASSPKNLPSAKTYSIDVYCYDSYYNLLDTQNNHAVSKTCYQIPKAVITTESNDDGSVTFNWTITNPDNLACSNYRLRVRNSTGNFIKLGTDTYVSIEQYQTQGTDSITGQVTIPSFGLDNKSYTAVIYGECDIADGDGTMSRSLGSKQFTAGSISKLGSLYLKGVNVTDKTIKSELAGLTDADEIEAKKKEYSTRAVLEFSLNLTDTNANLLPHVKALNVKLTTTGDSLEIALTDEQINTLKAGGTIKIDTNDYTYDSNLGIVAGLQSNSSYSVIFSACDYIESTDTNGEEVTEKVKIQVSSTLTKFKTSIMPVEVLIDSTTEAVYQGFISMDIKINDVDGIISGDTAVLRITSKTDGSLLGAFNIEKNVELPFELRLSADKNTSNNGLSYDILANTTYVFSFIAAEAYPEEGYKTNYTLKEFSKDTGESLTGQIFSMGLSDNASDVSKYKATLGLTLNVPTSKSFSQSMKQGDVYVDRVRILDGVEGTPETIATIGYDESGINGSDYWVCEDSELGGYAVDESGKYISNTASETSGNCTIVMDESQFEAEKAASNSHLRSVAEVDGITVYSNIPSGYTQVEYVESTGTQYIDTGVKPSASLQADITLSYSKFNSENMSFGVSSASNYASGTNYVFDYTSKTVIAFGEGSSNGGTSTLATDTIYSFTLNKDSDATLYLNGTKEVTSNRVKNFPDYTIYLFGRNVAGAKDTSSSCWFVGKIYSFKLTDTSTGSVLREFVPVIRESDNAYGMYDVINSKFYGNSGSGTFTGGSAIADAYYYIEDEVLSLIDDSGVYDQYYELEYLKSTGTQYIDTGMPVHMGYKYSIDFNINTTGNYRIWGAFNQNSSTSGLGTALTWYSSSDYAVRWQSTSAGNIYFIQTQDYKKHNIVIDDGSVYWDGTYKWKSSTHDTDAVSKYNAFIFTVNPGGNSPSYIFNGKIYSYQVWDKTGTLVQDMIPVLRISDNKPGMYDRVSHKFYTNMGKGEFLYETKYTAAKYDGSYINSNQDKLPTGYIAADYIESTGSQYIDTGFVGNEGVVEYSIKFNNRSQASGTVLYGASDSNTKWNGFLYYSGTSNGSSTIYSYVSNRGGYFKTTVTNFADHEAGFTVNNNTKSYSLYVDDSTYSGTFSSTISSNTVALFAQHGYSGTGTYVHKYTGRIYSFQIIKDGVLARNFIPCINPDGEAGMYDTVTQQFYGNIGTGSFTAGRTTRHRLVKAHVPYTITTELDKDSNEADSYRFDYYFKYNIGTTVTKVKLASVSMTTEAEVYTIKNGYEFKTKGQRNHKYVVVDDISVDCSGQSSYTYASGSNFKAQIDFQGYTLDYTSNYYPLFERSEKTAEISNLVLKVHAPLNRLVNNPDGYQYQCCGVLIDSYYGTATDLYIEYDQEAFPYEYDVTSYGGYWSDLEAAALNSMIKEEAELYEYAFPARAASFCGYLYGTIDGFVVDLKTPMRGASWVGPLCYGAAAGSSVKNGYVFSSANDDYTAEVISYYNKNHYVYDINNENNLNDYAIGGVVGRVDAKASVSNVFALVNVMYKTDTYAYHVGGIAGWEYEAGAIVSSSYMVGSTYNYTTRTPKDLGYGPAVGTAVDATTSEDVYYITPSSFEYTSTLNTKLSYQALYSSEWQDHLLNNGGSRFIVTALVDTECYPQVNWNSTSMPSQKMIPLPTFKSSSQGADFDIAYSYTYTGDPSKVDPYSKTKTIGNTAWDNKDYLLADAADPTVTYTPLEYIESTGSEYIDTGYIPGSENIEVEAKFAAIVAGGGLFGVMDYTSGSLSQSVSAMVEGSNLFVGAGTTEKVQSQSVDAGQTHSINLKTSSQQLSFILDSKAVYDDYSGILNKADSIYIFALNGGAGTGATNYSTTRLYYFNIYEDGTLVKEFVPVKRNDGTVGLYEKQEGKFYTAGGGALNNGPESTYYDSDDQILCILLSDEDATRTVYSVDIDGFALTHDDVLYQNKDGSGINTVYVRMHNPKYCYSEYIIKSITFEDNSSVYTSNFSYERTVNVEFFKVIHTATGGTGYDSWDDIRSRHAGEDFNENLILKEDIDFAGVTFDKIMINSKFTGILDGNGKTIKNIDYDPNLASTLGLKNANTTSSRTTVGLIKTVTGTVKDLTLDSIHIEAGWDAGALAAEVSGGVLDHVYVLNSYISGGRLLGGLAAYTNGSIITGCSVVDSKIVHGSSGYYTGINSTVTQGVCYYTGGLIGCMYSGCDVTHSFVSDTYIETIYNSYQAITGGLIGEIQYTGCTVTSCYATGYIVSTTEYTGGLIGYVYKAMTDCSHNYTDTDIYSYTGWASGVIGYNTGSTNNFDVGIAFGNILSPAIYDRTDDERVTNKNFYGCLKDAYSVMGGTTYASARNYIITPDSGAATKLAFNYYSGEEGHTGSSNFSGTLSYSEYIGTEALENLLSYGFSNEDASGNKLVSNGRLPMLKDEDGNLLPNQGGVLGTYGTDNYGVGIAVDDSSLEFTKQTDGTYSLELTIYHDGSVSVNNICTDFTFVAENCGMIDPETGKEYAADFNSLTRTANFTGGSTNKLAGMGRTTLEVSGLKLNTCMDTYYITAIEYRDNNTGETKYFKVGLPLEIEQQWREVADYDDYVEYVFGSHLENFSITGDIDFDSSFHSFCYYNNTLNNVVNRMVGTGTEVAVYHDDGTGTYVYDKPSNSYPTISDFAISDTGLEILNDGQWARVGSRGLIGCVVSEFGKLNVENVNISGYCVGLGLIGECHGRVHHVNISDFHLNNPFTGYYSATGFVGYFRDAMDNMYVENTTVSDYYGMSGTLAGRVLMSHNCYLDSIYVHGVRNSEGDSNVSVDVTRYGYSGGVVGYSSALSYISWHGPKRAYTNIKVEDIDVSTMYYYTGGVFGLLENTGDNVKNVSISGSTVTDILPYTGSDFIGAITGYLYSTKISDSSVDNCVVKADSVKGAGGVTGYENYNGKVYSTTVTNTTVINGGSVSNNAGAGGICGYSNYGYGLIFDGNTVDNCTVSAPNSYAGGVTGYSYGYSSSDTITNNTVKNSEISSFARCGGIVGYSANVCKGNMDISGNQVYKTTIASNSDYAGGIIAYGTAVSKSNIVEDCVIAGTNYVGGISGYVTYNPKSVPSPSYVGSNSGEYAGLVNNTRIYGISNVGGAVGGILYGRSSGNLIVKGCSIYGRSCVGGVLGYGNPGDIYNAPGYVYNSSVDSCLITELDASAVGDAYAVTGVSLGTSQVASACGGIVGYGGGSSSCMVYNSIIGSENMSMTGGIQGCLAGCYNSGVSDDSISNICKDSVVRGDAYVGGLFGAVVPSFAEATSGRNINLSPEARVTVKNCYSNAKVVGNDFVSGIAGYYSSGSGKYEYYSYDSSTAIWSLVSAATVADQSAFTALITDSYFTGSVTALDGSASGFIGFADIASPYADVSSSYLPSTGRTDYWKMSLMGVSSMPEYIKGNLVYPVISSMGSNTLGHYDISTMAGEAQYQYLAMWTGTDFDDSGDLTAEKLLTDDSSFENVDYSQYIAPYGSIIGYDGSRTGSDEFIVLMGTDSAAVSALNSAKVTANVENHAYTQALRSSDEFYDYNNADAKFREVEDAGYTVLDYIESTGTQYINTGIKLDVPNSTLEVEIIYNQTGTASDQSIFGNERLSFSMNLMSTKYEFGYGNAWNTYNSTPRNRYVDLYVYAKPGTQRIYENGTLLYTASQSAYSSNETLKIFRSNTYLTTGKLYRFKLIIDGAEKFDGIPCKDGNGNVGLYDVVSDTFFKSAATAQFVAGPESVLGGTAFAQYSRLMPLLYYSTSTLSESLLFGGYSTEVTMPSGSSLPINAAQGVPLPGHGNINSGNSDEDLEQVYTDYFTNGTLPSEIGHTGLETVLAKYVSVDAVGIDKLELTFEYTSDTDDTDFFSGVDQKGIAFAFDPIKDSVGFTMTTDGSSTSTIQTKLLNVAARSSDDPVQKNKTFKSSGLQADMPVYDFTYNFMDKLRIVITYTIDGETNSFGIYVDPENLAVGNAVRNVSEQLGTKTYLISDGKVYESSGGPLVATNNSSGGIDGYTVVEYIEADKGQYINTGIYGSTTNYYDIQFEPNGAGHQITGYRYSVNDVWGVNSSGYYWGSGTTTNLLAGNRDNIIWKYIYDNNTQLTSLTINGVKYGETAAARSMDSEYLRIFSCYTSYDIQAKLYSIKIVEEKTDGKTWYGIPCIQDSTGKTGLYLYNDTDGRANGKFLSNANTSNGDFTAGPEVSYDFVHLWKVKDSGGNVTDVQVLSSSGEITSLTGLVSLYEGLSGGTVDAADEIKASVDVAVTGVDEITVSFNKNSNNPFKYAKTLKYSTSKVINSGSILNTEIASGTVTNSSDTIKLKYNFVDTYTLKLDYVLYDGTQGTVSIPLAPTASLNDGTYSVSGSNIIRTADSKVITVPTAEYKIITYLESTGSQYVMTDYYPGSDTSIILDTVIKSNGSGGLLGASTSGWSGSSYGFNGSISNFYINYNSDTSIGSIASYTDRRIIVKRDKNQTYLDGTLVYTHGNVQFKSTQPLAIFRFNLGGSMSTSSNQQLYSLMIFENGVLERNYIPVLRISDNVLGLYDAKNGTFLSNKGSSTFKAGADAYSSVPECLNIYDGKALLQDGRILDLGTLVN